MKCIGFGDREDHCDEEATAPAGIWCAGCETERRCAIAAAFDRAGAQFAADLVRAGAPS